MKQIILLLVSLAILGCDSTERECTVIDRSFNPSTSGYTTNGDYVYTREAYGLLCDCGDKTMTVNVTAENYRDFPVGSTVFVQYGRLK